jgi:hypothetical protein
VATSESTATRRRWPWVAAGLALLLVAGLAWLGWGLLGTARQVKTHAAAAQEALVVTQSAIASGDIAAAKSAAAQARTEVDAARSESQAASLRLLAHLPVVSQAVDDVDHLISAADHVVSATDRIVSVYGQATGRDPSAVPLFGGSRINLAALRSLATEVGQVDLLLGEAQSDLGDVQATLPGTASLAAARDAALAQVVPLRATLAQMKRILPLVPRAVGADGPKRYLITILNQGEMRASGGAPLSVAVLVFDKGRFSVPIRGQLSLLRKPGIGVLTWKGAVGSPWNDVRGNRTATFAKANFNPDFRSAGFDLANAWESGGAVKVDGVIAIDTTAIASVLRRTGPIATDAFGELNADNLGQKLLIDSYRDFSNDQLLRIKANQVVVDTMLSRLTSGSDLLAVVRALGDAAPGRHVQVYVKDSALAAETHALGLDGAVSSPSGDRVAVFTQNVNASKVDVFNQRTIEVSAQVHADGSALVTQRLTVRNAVPRDLKATTDRVGYTTTWSTNAYFLYRPTNAENVELTLPEHFALDPWPGAAEYADDGHGQWMMRLVGTLAPRASAEVLVSYTLPPGTFVATPSGITYTLTADPAPSWVPERVALVVSGPSGQKARWATTLDRKQEVSLTVR